MGWFDGGSTVSSGGRSHHKRRQSSHHHSRRSRSKSHSRSRSNSRERKAASVISFFAGAPLGAVNEQYHKRNSSKSSFFGHGNTSKGSFFGLGSGRTPSYYKRSPRSKFMHRAWKKLKRILRDIVHYAKRHPWKVFMLVIMPLITTGALAGLLARFGLRLPRAFERMLGMAAKAGTGDSMGLVSDAMRMAGELGNSGGTATRSYSYQNSGGGGVSYGRGRTEVDADWGSWGLGDGLKYVSKIFT